MKKEWIMAAATIIVTLLVALGLIRWMAPQLIGIPADLQLVKVNKKIPPFYEGIFRKEDYRSQAKLLNDPYTRVRARPLYQKSLTWGPHDILGFRNRFVPNVADIVAIGDSQTYGNNVFLEENWPSRLAWHLGEKKPVLYSMATGGWGAVQYMDIFEKALLFKPRVVVVAFYSGNDSLESFHLAYSVKRWAHLRLNPKLNASDMPPGKYPPPESEWWPVVFKDGAKTTFTPKHRLGSNMDHPAVKAGYAIMKETARQMSDSAGKSNVRVVFIIIPTKELVFAEKVRREGIDASSDYLALIGSEGKNYKDLASELKMLPNAVYVDLLTPMRQEALTVPLYPPTTDGHPVAAGYNFIARVVAPVVDEYIPVGPRGLLLLETSPKDRFPVLADDDGVWLFRSRKIIIANGWRTGNIPIVQPRDIATLPLRGVITTVDPQRFGPPSIE